MANPKIRSELADEMRETPPLQKQTALTLVRLLCQELNAKGIAYCHWKSNAMLDRSAMGENDLDLLVDRSDAQLFARTLYGLGFRKAQDPPGQEIPGVLDYYGYDVEADRLVHVHSHYQLVLGHDATKNYHLPVERPYLESAAVCGLFKIPAPEFEWILFVIRMVLKHSTWDVILGGQGTLSTAERQEMSYLQERASEDSIVSILKQNFPYLDARLFDDCIRSLQPNSSFWFRVRVGRRLIVSLKAHARRSQISDVWLKLWRRLVEAFRRRVLGHKPGKRMADGGLMVAIIGGDGAGKTTAVEGLHAWLSQDFEVIKVHMGKPPWAWISILVRGILKIGRTIGLYPFMRADIQYTLDDNLLVFPGYPWLFREICTARERYLAYSRARRSATNGMLVLCDRFPLPEIRLMDGPQAERMTRSCKTNRLIKFLIALESKYYRPISLPDLLIVLKTDPEIAVQRKSDEDAQSVWPRSKEIWDLDWRQASAYLIDGGRSKAEVLSELKALIWSRL